MKILICFSVLISNITFSIGLKCISCKGFESIDECDAAGQIEQCMPNQESCETVVRRYSNHMMITKGCKNERACKDNQMQNTMQSGSSTQCNTGQPNSFCTCCCEGDLCNVGNPSCASNYISPQPDKDCPQVSPNFPHGNVKCYDENKSGSVCEYQCTGMNYTVWPQGHDTTICLTNGSWSQKRPCCARPCPPFYLLDDVFLYHFEGENAENDLIASLNKMKFPVISEDAIKAAALYYSSQVIEASVVKFNEYGGNAERYVELTKERIQVQNEGGVNTGAAILYALENLFTSEAGMRDDRVPKAIWIMFSNANPEGDFKGPAEVAREKGILIFVIGHGTNGFQFDREKMVELTGEEKHVYLTDEPVGSAPKLRVDVNSFFCQDPCKHVLHDHE